MLGNIIETYPVGTLLSIILIVTIAFSYLNNRLIKRESFILPLVPNLWGRLKCAASIFLCLAAAYFVLDGAQAANISPNRYNQEIAKNETYSFFNAFLANKLDYGEFYITRDDAANIKDLQEIYRAANVTYKENDTLKRFIKADGAEKRKNVVLVIMESMSSSFMNENNPEGENLTPNLTRLAEEGLYFANVYATGTRTVRGLEAATLSMPPQTGMSIIRQKGNENLQNIGTLFKERGYDVSWIYGGYGYFDNMNDFFRNNGFSVTDRTDISADKIHHETTWGVADEDLFTKAIESADQSAANGSSFFQLILTTSNHSPYTYPDGRIDIEAGTRKGAVKYADWAVGDFVARAKEKPWFNDTIFVFLGDHGAASAGKKELNPSTHKVVSVIYSPSEIAPQRIDKTISQIDVMPTVLGLLNFSYEASFMGRDALAAPDDGRYFISNYQYVGYGEKDRLLILKPVRESVYYNGDNEENENNKEDAPDETMLNRAVAYYQYAAKWQEILR
jgi:phosphoglycerol transferase MdoB-like AlkP superfamily enzyme